MAAAGPRTGAQIRLKVVCLTLSFWPTGLADGLAPKERRYALGRAIRPDYLVPPPPADLCFAHSSVRTQRCSAGILPATMDGSSQAVRDQTGPAGRALFTGDFADKIGHVDRVLADDEALGHGPVADVEAVLDGAQDQ